MSPRNTSNPPGEHPHLGEARNASSEGGEPGGDAGRTQPRLKQRARLGIQRVLLPCAS